MSVYLVVLEKPDESVWTVLKEKWPDRQHYILDKRLAFIAPEPRGKVLLVEDICDALGMGPQNQVTGIVSQVSDATNGWQEQPFWEWFAKVPK